MLEPDVSRGELGLDAGVDRLFRQQLEELVTSMCKALNDPKRLLVLYALRDAPRSVSELSRLLDIPQANASQHLAVLRERGVVAAQRQATTVVYSLRHPKVLDAVDLLREVMAEELERRRSLG